MAAILSAICPVFLIAGVAYILRRRLHFDVRTLSTLNVYVFVPALIFSSLSKSDIEWGLLGRFAGASVVSVLLMVCLLATLAYVRRMETHQRNAFLMTLFPNLGNFGLPVVMFAFPEEALVYGVVVLVCGSLLQNTLGVYFAQRSRHGIRKALARVFSFPMVYAFALALLAQRTQWDLPIIFVRAVDLMAGAAIPVQIFVLGAQLVETRLERGVNVFLAVAARLCAGPALAFVTVLLVGLEGLPAKVFILQTSGPVAVAIAVYGVQFDVKPGYLASVVSWSFLLSIVTVSVVLAVLLAVPL